MATTSQKSTFAANPNVDMRMSLAARARMLSIEKVMPKYYNDMGKNLGNCTWGPGFFAHKGVCSAEELQHKVSAPSIDIEYEKRVREAERKVKQHVMVPLNQAQFDALVSFTYNTTNRTAKRVYDALNTGNFAAAANAISSAIKTDVGGGRKVHWKVAPGLLLRRAEESAPFRIPKSKEDR
jgi:GH24 family phage-related lysozyme (muramidase)